MTRKSQITVTLNPKLLEQLRSIAKQRGQSLSKVIEEHLLSKSKLGEESEAKRILQALSEIKNSIKKKDSQK